MLHVCAKSDEEALMANLWAILHKFQMYDFLQLRNDSKETCLHLACAYNKAKLVRDLLRFGIDVNSVDIRGDTALHVAIQENCNDCVDAILNTNQNEWRQEIEVALNILNDSGYSPLHLAAKKNNLIAIKMLNDKAMASNQLIYDVVETKHGNNALHVAIESNSRNVIEYLIQNKLVSPTRVNQSGHTG